MRQTAPASPETALRKWFFAGCDTDGTFKQVPSFFRENKSMEQNQYPPIIADAQPNQVPEGELVAYFENRQHLQHAIKKLTDQDFPLQTLFVVGRNITQVEYIGGKVTYPKVILSSAISGAAFGAFIGLLSALLTGSTVIPHLLSSIPLGIIIWVLSGLFTYARAQKKGGGAAITMRGQTIPGSLELRAHWKTVERARQILGVGSYQRPAQPQWNQPGVVQPSASSVAAPATEAENNLLQTDPNQPPAAPTSFVGPEYNKDGSKAGSTFGLRIEDPEEYAAALRQEPAPVNQNDRIQQIRAENKQQRYGIRIDDPQAFEETVRKAPEAGDKKDDAS